MVHKELTYNIGYSPKVSSYLAMFENNRERLFHQLKDVTDQMLDYTPNDKTVETIGTLLLHIAATEKDWISVVIDNQEPDNGIWKYAIATRFDDLKQLKEKGLQFYLDKLNETREKTVNRFRRFTDEELKEVVTYTSDTFTIEWILFHLINHEAMHLGQISLLNKVHKLKKI